MKYNKLIRDKIPEYLESKDIKYKIHTATEKEYSQKLREKLQEEVKEFSEDNNIGELADIVEVIHALSYEIGLSPEELEKVRLKKKYERGGFNKNLILEESGD
jgi:predicted house-cleaning noncanonical NTP pyrophosphatase (MazG superfamily)